MNEFSLYQALLIGAIASASLLILIGIYVKLRSPIQHWIATLRMKSLFRKDRQKQVRKPKDTMTENTTDAPYLIVGLGNPGPHFREDRHNIGFMVLDHLLKRLGLAFSRSQQNALLTDGKIDKQKVFFAKPQTFMNTVGKAIAPLSRYYRIPLEHLLIVFDDLDLPLGTLRIRPQGGSGGHKGMQSILGQMNTENIPRMRIGIGRPPGQMDPADFVLQAFSKDEMEIIGITLERAADAIEVYISDGIEASMTRFNTNSQHE
jgi:PTH1 family peptidyl-tRNA hydrolase